MDVLDEPCTESFCQAMSLTGYQQYLKYRVDGSGEAVYQCTPQDKQASAINESLTSLAAENESLLEQLGFETMEEAEADMQEHLKRLHEYNEFKDAGQSLIGRLAVLRETTTRKLYPDFGLDVDD